VSRAFPCLLSGALVLSAGGTLTDWLPSQESDQGAIDVVDTTGCGDAFSAGFLRGIALGRSRTASATLGCAAAGLVAQGLGTDRGDFDLDAADAFAAQTPAA
jgi:sugar/nucleoside kinase (ribokinase family)